MKNSQTHRPTHRGTHRATQGVTHWLVPCVAGVLLLAALPYLLTQGLLNAAIQMLIAALFASAYNLLCGQAGMLGADLLEEVAVVPAAIQQDQGGVGLDGLIQQRVGDFDVGGAAGVLQRIDTD